MPVTVESQVYIFLYSILGGILIAFIYDLFRIKRKAVKTAVILISLEDLIFWFIVSIIMFMVVYNSNDGEIRGFIFLGTAIGIILYATLLSRIIINFSLFVLRLIFKILYFIWMVITYPFRFIFKLAGYPIRFLIKIIKRFVRKIRNVGRNNTHKIKFWRRVFKNARKKI